MLVRLCWLKFGLLLLRAQVWISFPIEWYLWWTELYFFPKLSRFTKLTLSELNLFKEIIKKKKLKNVTKQVKSKSIYFSCQYRKQLNSIGKHPNYDLITPNGIIRHFIVFIEAEEMRKLLIAIGITRSERVNFDFSFISGIFWGIWLIRLRIGVIGEQLWMRHWIFWFC